MTPYHQGFNRAASHHVVLLDISVSIVRFGDQICTCRVNTHTSHEKQTSYTSTKVSWLLDGFSDNNVSGDGLSLSVSVAVNKQILEVILMPGNDAILVVYQINTQLCLHFVKSTPINNSLKEAVQPYCT